MAYLSTDFSISITFVERLVNKDVDDLKFKPPLVDVRDVYPDQHLRAMISPKVKRKRFLAVTLPFQDYPSRYP